MPNASLLTNGQITMISEAAAASWSMLPSSRTAGMVIRELPRKGAGRVARIAKSTMKAVRERVGLCPHFSPAAGPST